MILKLAIEQARSQRRYTLWIWAFMSMALTFIAFALLIVATQRTTLDAFERVSLIDREHRSGGAQVYREVPVADNSYYRGQPTVEDVDQILAEAIAGGSDVAATREWAVVTRPALPEYQLFLAAATGAYDWDLVLVEGHLPNDGEILLNAKYADELDLGTGDTIDLLYSHHPPSVDEPASEADWHTYTISGLARSCDSVNALLADNEWFCGDTSYVSWEASSAPNGPLACTICTINESGDTGPVIPMAQIAWNIDHPALAELPLWMGYSEEDMASWSRPSPPIVTQVGYALAGLVVIGMLLASLAVGRSQAQARIQWVATARTLGATRRSVVGATLLESLLVALAAVGVSLMIGYGLATIAFSWMSGFRGATIGPDFVPMPWWVVAAVTLVGAVLSLLIASVPAFWASRVSPVAAFKPVTDVTEVEISRRVPLWWIAPAFLGGIAALWLDSRGQGSVGFMTYLGAIFAGTTGFVLVKEGLNALVSAVGRRFARARSGVLQVTGDAWVSSRRNAVTLALLFALPAALVSCLMVVNNLSNLDAHLAAGLPSSTWPLPDHESAFVWATEGVLWAAILLVEFEAVALAITFASRWASAGDAATRRALGLSTLQQRQAAFVRHVAPQVGGAIVGAVLGFGLGVATHFLTALGGISTRSGITDDYLPAWWDSIASTGYGVLLVAAFASLGGLIVAAAASRVRPPVEALKPIGKVRAR